MSEVSDLLTHHNARIPRTGTPHYAAEKQTQEAHAETWSLVLEVSLELGC